MDRTRSSRGAGAWAVGLAIWVCTSIYVWHGLDRGWVPHDEGTLGHSAERVLAGEMPHRDFDEVYTGGLSYLNAAAFTVFGTDLRSIRSVLFIFFLAWVPIVFRVAMRFTAPVMAGLVTLLAVAWSVPNYSAAVPSWYNLFLATFALLALLRFVETDRKRWLFAAGVCGGLSVLAKLTGVFVLAAGLLFIAYCEQVGSRGEQPAAAASGQSRLYSGFLGTSVILVVVTLFLLVRRLAGPAEIFHFVVPGIALGGLLLWNERAPAALPSSLRFRALAGLVVPLAVGAALPVAVFALPYAVSGALDDLMHGIFVSPMRRLSFASRPPSPIFHAVFLVPFLLLLVLSARFRAPVRWFIALALAVPLCLLLAGGRHPAVYLAVWGMLRSLVPVTVVTGALLVALAPGRAPPGAGPSPDGQAHRPAVVERRIVAALAMAGFCSLVQFPFSAPIYFLYVGPLVALAALAIVCGRSTSARPVFAVLVAFQLVFAVRWINPGFIYEMGIAYEPDEQTAILALDRGQIRVSATDKAEYEALVSLLQAHSGGSRYTFATPDAPEVYFLSRLANPTRTIFDFFDDPAGRAERILHVLDEEDVHVVVLNREPAFSGPPPGDLVEAIEARFPSETEVGQFVVRWRP